MCSSSLACDAITLWNCTHYLGSFADDEDALSYIKATKCPAPGTAGMPIAGYLSCNGISLQSFAAYVTFTLPPFLIKQACDNAPRCDAFSVNAAGTFGRLYSARNATANMSSALKLTTSSPPRPAVSLSVRELREKAADFVKLPGLSLAPPARVVAYDDWEGAIDNTLVTMPLLSTLCTATPCNCDVHINRPYSSAATTGDARWSMWKLTANPNVSTYIHTSFCNWTSSSYLSCIDLDATQGGLRGEHYDVSDNIMRQICNDKRCHAYVQNNDDSGGTLFTFTRAAGVNSYFPVRPN